MVILLDIDGVLVTEPPWKKVESDVDGFMLFNKQSATNLATILSETNASVVLTSTHRINFELEKWIQIFAKRGLNIHSISKLNDKRSLAEMLDRGTEIKEWVDQNNLVKNYVIIDDDTSINGLSQSIKDKWVITKPFIGIDEEVKQKVLKLLLKQ
jgi:hypothetical protein